MKLCFILYYPYLSFYTCEFKTKIYISKEKRGSILEFHVECVRKNSLLKALKVSFIEKQTISGVHYIRKHLRSLFQ
jgi:hypothetical protein